MRTTLIALCALAVTAMLAVGVRQASDGAGASDRPPSPLTRAAVSAPIAGAPAQLAALRRQVSVLRGGGLRAFDDQLQALRGHPVVVNLWASWCGPCRRELPLFQREANRLGARVAFLGVNVDDERDAAEGLAARYPMPYPSFSDPRSNIAIERFGSRALPVTAFFDARGELAIVRQGEFPTQAKLAAAIERYALR